MATECLRHGTVSAFAGKTLVKVLRPKVTACLWAVGMTFLLFAILPVMLHPGKPPVATTPLLDQINVIRLARPETPPERKPPEPQVMKPKAVKPVPEKAVHQQKPQNLNLPFELNPKISGLPVVPDLPAMKLSAGAGGFELPDVFDAGDLDQPLVTLSRQEPLYPLYAKQRNIQGEVRVRFIVNKAGQIENISIVSARPAEIFDRSVISCVSGWRFRPGTVEGVPVDSWTETTIRFVLQ